MKTIKCRLLSVKCFRSSESDGDEIYLKFNGKRIWPTSASFEKMLPDSESKLNIALDGPNSDGQIKIQLYDADTFFDDRLGTFQLDLRGATGIFNTDLGDKKLGAHYQIAWETYY